MRPLFAIGVLSACVLAASHVWMGSSVRADASADSGFGSERGSTPAPNPYDGEVPAFGGCADGTPPVPVAPLPPPLDTRACTPVEAAIGDPEGPATPRELLAHVLFSSQVDAQLARSICHGARTVEPGLFAGQAATLEEVARRSQHSDRPFIFDTGGMFAPQGVGRYAMHQAPEALARMLAELGYGALALGIDDLAGAREALIHTAQALRKLGVPLLADNLHCREGTELCDVLVSARDGVSIHVQGKTRIALIAVLPDNALEGLPRDRSETLWIEPPAEAIARKTRAAKAQGVEAIIATIDFGIGAKANVDALRLAQDIPADAHPDVVVAADAGKDLLFARPVTVTPAVAAGPTGGLGDLQIRRQLLGNAHDVVIRPLPATDQRSRALDRFVSSIGPSYCRDWGVAFPGGTLNRPLDLEGMRSLTAAALRDATSAEVAVIPHILMNPEWQPADQRLTLGDIYTAQRFADSVMLGHVNAAWLDRLAQTIDSQRGDDHDVFALGVARIDGQTRVGGRPLDPDATYKVAVTRRALASGQLPAGPEWRRRQPLTARSALRELLETQRSVDPRDDLYDPADSVIWTLRANVDGTFSGSKVSERTGAPAYNVPQLTTGDNVTLGFQSMFIADADHPHWGWSNAFMTRYQRTRTAGPNPGVAEGADLITLQSNLEYRAWREDAPYPFVPSLFIQSYLESEFTIPDEERPWRHMLLRPTSGLRFTLTEELSVKVAAGFETQLLDPDGRAQPGAGLELVLRPWDLLREGTRRVQIDGDLNYFVTGLFADEFQTLRGRFNASIDLAGPLALTMGINLFAQRVSGVRHPVEDRNVGWILSAIATAGLRIQWHDRIR